MIYLSRISLALRTCILRLCRVCRERVGSCSSCKSVEDWRLSLTRALKSLQKRVGLHFLCWTRRVGNESRAIKNWNLIDFMLLNNIFMGRHKIRSHLRTLHKLFHTFPHSVPSGSFRVNSACLVRDSPIFRIHKCQPFSSEQREKRGTDD
jgi:hypothetical protein